MLRYSSLLGDLAKLKKKSYRVKWDVEKETLRAG